MEVILHTPEGNLSLAIALLTIFSGLFYILYAKDDGWSPDFHLLFFAALILCSFWAFMSLQMVEFGDYSLPHLKHFVNAFLLSLASTFYFIVSFLMYVVEEKSKTTEQ